MESKRPPIEDTQQQQQLKRARCSGDDNDDDDVVAAAGTSIVLQQELGAAQDEFKAVTEEMETFTGKDKHTEPYFALVRRHSALEFDLVCLNVRQNNGVHTKLVTGPQERHAAFPPGFAQRLGQALVENTQVTEMSLCLDLLLPFHSKNTEVESYIEPLVHYLTTSAVLRKVQLYCGQRYFRYTGNVEHYNTLVESLLNAIASNPTIQDVGYSCEAPARVLASFLSRSTAATLRLDFSSHKPTATTENDIITQAFGTMSATIKSLSLEGVVDNPNLTFAILQQLSAAATLCPAPFGLTELKLTFGSADDETALECWETLARFLHATRGVLQHLELNGFRLDEAQLSRLLVGLHRRDDPSRLSSDSIVKLSLSACDFDEAASDIFISFMQTPVSLDSTNDSSSSLRELRLDGDPEWGTHGPFRNREQGPTIARILQTVPTPEGSGKDTVHRATVGSQIHTLSLGSLYDYKGFFSTLAQSSGTQLKSLRLEDMVLDNVLELEKCTDKLQSIRYFHLTTVRDGYDRLVEMFCRNGHIRSLLAGSGDLFTPVQWRRVKAYHKRNRFFKQFARDARSKGPSSSSKLEAAARAKKHSPQKHVYPRLLQVAQQVPSMQSQTVLRALLSLKPASK